VIRVLDQLHEAGIRIAVDDEAVRSECTRIGRQLLDGGKRIVGLLPAGERVSLPAIAIQLARALFEIDGRPVAIVDAAATWPVRVVPDRAEFTASRIIDGLVLLTPRHADPGGMEPRLATLLRDETAGFGVWLLDLTGLARLGEHVTAMALCDAVATVARAGVTREADLAHAVAEVDADRDLGVLLVGA